MSKGNIVHNNMETAIHTCIPENRNVSPTNPGEMFLICQNAYLPFDLFSASKSEV